MNDFSWAPTEIRPYLSRQNGKLMLGCSVEGCRALRVLPGKTATLKRYERNPSSMLLCRSHGGKHGKFTQEEIASWPEGHKRCKECSEVKLLDSFHNHSTALFGKSVICKDCRRPLSKTDTERRTVEQGMHAAAKHRAKKSGIDFNIEVEDIVIPEKCPVFGVPLVKGDPKFAPSLDRINSSKGYVKGNIQVLSRWANTLKGDATMFEIEALFRFMFGCDEYTKITFGHISEGLPEGSPPPAPWSS